MIQTTNQHLVMTGSKWDYTLHKWGDLVLITRLDIFGGKHNDFWGIGFPISSMFGCQEASNSGSDGVGILSSFQCLSQGSLGR